MTTDEIAAKYGGKKMDTASIAKKYGGVPVASVTPDAPLDPKTEIAKGALKGPLSTVLTISSAGNRLFEGAYNKSFIGKKYPLNTGTVEMVEGVKGKYATATNDWQKLGFGAEQLAEMFIPIPGLKEAKMASLGTRLATDVGEVGLKSALQSGDPKKAALDATLTAGFGGGLTAAQMGVNKWGGKAAGGLINSLLKPVKDELSFGKDPGGAVAREGIVATSLDDLATKIGKKADEAYAAVEKEIAARSKGFQRATVLPKDVFSPIEDALAEARKFPQTNGAIIGTLEKMKTDFQNHYLTDIQLRAFNIFEMGKPFTSFEDLAIAAVNLNKLKSEVGDLIRYTGVKADDSLINKALGKVYANLNSALEKIDPGLKVVNDRFDNLQAARKAIENRSSLVERGTILSELRDKATTIGAISGIALGGGVGPAAAGWLIAGGLSHPRVYTPIVTALAKKLATASPAEADYLLKMVPSLTNVLIPKKETQSSSSGSKRN